MKPFVTATVTTSYRAAQILGTLLKVPVLSEEDLGDFLRRAADNLRQSGRSALIPVDIGRLAYARTEYMLFKEVMGEKKFTPDFLSELEHHGDLEPILMFDASMRGAMSPYVVMATPITSLTSTIQFRARMGSVMQSMARPAGIFNTKHGWHIAAFPFRSFTNYDQH